MLHWQQRLNLMDWRVERGKGIANKAMASVSTNFSARLATYKTGDWGAQPATPESIRETALHEMLHVLLAELQTFRGPVSGVEPDVLESIEHRVVNTLDHAG